MGLPKTGARVWLLAGAAAVVLVVLGVVAWLALPGKSGSPAAAPAEASHVTGETVTKVLLTGDELSTLLGQPFKSTTGRPVYGGFDEMEVPTSTGDCVGVMNVAPQQVYSPTQVRSYARQTFSDATPGEGSPHRLSGKVMFVEESVVALPTAADARAVFATFADQWKRCDGRAVNPAPDSDTSKGPPRLPGTEIHISDVQVTDTTLAASIGLDQKPDAPDTRAVGVQGNCIVGILIAFTGEEHGAGSAQPETSSTEAVRAMMAKVAQLS